MADDTCEPKRIAPIGFLSVDACGNVISVTVDSNRYILRNRVGRRCTPLKPCYENDKAVCALEMKRNG